MKSVSRKTRGDKIIYKLTIEDLRNVADEELERALTEDEIKILEAKLGDYVDWYGAIQSTIFQHLK